MRRICVVGTGYVGLVTGTCLADFGNVVYCVDRDEEKIGRLRSGVLPIYEPGLKELVEHNLSRGRLSFSTEVPFAIKSSEIIFIAVGTPSTPDGEMDITQVLNVAATIAEHMEDYKAIVNKSTVSVGTGAKVEAVVRERQREPIEFDVVSNPEFLREGSAIEDFMRPNRVVVGARSQRALDLMREVYRVLYLIETPMILTDVETAEMIKLASNAFLATKISFINEIANVCEGYGADVHVVARAMGLDGRIGSKFLHPGAGFGGSCLPKDVRGFASIAQKIGLEAPIVRAVLETNERQRVRMVEKLREFLGDFKDKTVALLGLSFKPNTDDIREAPALFMIRHLLEEGGHVRACDPAAMEATRRLYPQVEYYEDPYEAVTGADAVVLMTEWNEFRYIDLPRMRQCVRQPNFLDCRNVYDPKEMLQLGFHYVGVGRGMNPLRRV